MGQTDEDMIWFNPERIEGVLFYYNDNVRIKSGEHKGKFASIISLIPGEPITYLVELATWNGGDVQIAQSELERDE